nr:uncharacterized protein LOC123768291 isoform X2 [Procambarus clarkii]
MLSVVVVMMLLVGVFGGPERPDGCNYYCRKPAGPNKGENYCCGPEGLPIKREQHHRGSCAPPLKQCTGRFAAFAKPRLCPHDGHCSRDEKCCFDTCLDHHTCKPAQ